MGKLEGKIALVTGRTSETRLRSGRSWSNIFRTGLRWHVKELLRRAGSCARFSWVELAQLWRLQVEPHVHALQELVREQVGARAAQDEAAGLEDVAAMRGDERLVDGLLGEEHGHAGGVDSYD